MSCLSKMSKLIKKSYPSVPPHDRCVFHRSEIDFDDFNKMKNDVITQLQFSKESIDEVPTPSHM